MQVFHFDPADHREQYASEGWVHIPAGLDPTFLAELSEFVSGRFDSHQVAGRGIGGSKEQAVYEFPQGVDFPGHLFDIVAAVAGLRRAAMTLSERHIKAYDPDAPEEPPAHKDRLSSQVSVGLSIDIPQGSNLVLYPYDHRETNPFNVSAALRDSLPEAELPEHLLPGAREVVIEDQPGDVMMFQGSSMWHKRRYAAGAVNLYLKFNDFGSDPLGEDPVTEHLRAATVAAVRDGALAELVAQPARRLDTVSRQLTRDPGREVLQADVWGSKPVALNEAEVALLRGLDGGRPVADVLGEQVTERDVRRLAEHGAIDLVAP